jgi:deoxyadenosine/deoxycytidine kinase
MTKQAFVAEIVGPAGVGKSTLSRLLNHRDVTVRTGLSVWGLPAVLLLRNLCFALPVILDLYGAAGRLRWDEAKQIVRLMALHQLLKQAWLQNYQSLVLDEGAVFTLAKLYAFGSGNSKSRFCEKWLQDFLKLWAGTLDAVIWLDAPDSVLTERIRTRNKAHRVKEETDREIHEFLALYRASYEKIILELTTLRSLKVIRLNTELLAPERVADVVLAGLREEGRTWQPRA